MAQIPTPIASTPDPRRETVRLYFEDGKSGEYFMRGAIGWPEGRALGYALLAGQPIGTDEVRLFAEFPFVDVDHHINHQGDMLYRGLTQFLSMCRDVFYCTTFFYHQHQIIHRHYMLRVMDSVMIPYPKPEFIRVTLKDDEMGDKLIDMFLSQKRFKASREGSMLYEQMIKRGRINQEPDDNMSLHALRCLFCGMEYQGWMDPGPPAGFMETWR